MSDWAKPPKQKDLLEDVQSLFATAISNFHPKLDPHVIAEMFLATAVVCLAIGVLYIGIGVWIGERFIEYSLGGYAILGSISIFIASRKLKQG
jgi:hypothetical protein